MTLDVKKWGSGPCRPERNHYAVFGVFLLPEVIEKRKPMETTVMKRRDKEV